MTECKMRVVPRAGRILVTGATGNVGRCVLPELLHQGYAITAMVRGNVVPDGCDVVVGDLSEPRGVLPAAWECDGIVHLASPRSNNAGRVVHQDILGTASLLTAWRSGNFVYASSQTVYGEPQGELIETQARNAMCWYDLAKVVNEYQVSWAATRGGTRGAAVSLRLALLFGAGTRAYTQFLYPIVKACSLGCTFLFTSEFAFEHAGSSFIGDKDLGVAVVDALRMADSGEYNIATGYCTWQDLVRLVCRKLEVEPRFRVAPASACTRDDLMLPQSRSQLCCTQFHAATGFTPKDDVESLIDAFVVQWRRWHGSSCSSHGRSLPLAVRDSEPDAFRLTSRAEGSNE